MAISKIISTIDIKNVTIMKLRKILLIYSKLWTAHSAIKKKLFYSESEENKYPSSTPFSEIFSSSS